MASAVSLVSGVRRPWSVWFDSIVPLMGVKLVLGVVVSLPELNISLPASLFCFAEDSPAVATRPSATASGATAVQIVDKRHGVPRILEHVGSARSDAEVAVLLADAQERVHAGQQALDLDLADTGAALSARPVAVRAQHGDKRESSSRSRLGEYAAWRRLIARPSG